MVKEAFKMDRLIEMKEYILPKWNERFNKDISKVQIDYNRNQREIFLEYVKDMKRAHTGVMNEII